MHRKLRLVCLNSQEAVVGSVCPIVYNWGQILKLVCSEVAISWKCHNIRRPPK